MYSRICPTCGAYLDPGERCDCSVETCSQARTERAVPVKAHTHKLPEMEVSYKFNVMGTQIRGR